MENFNKFRSITSKLKEVTDGKISFDNIDEPNWMDIMQSGRYCRMLGIFDDSIWCYDQCFSMTDTLNIPENEKLKLNSTVLSAKALVFLQKGDYQTALKLCEDSLRLWSKNAEAYCNKGVAYNYISEHKKSLNFHKKAIELNPKLSQSWNAIGQLLVDNFNDPQNAIIYLDKALELSNGTDTMAWVNKGNALLKTNKFEEAILCWDTAFAIEPYNNIHAMINKALVLHTVLKNKHGALTLLNDLKDKITPSHKQYSALISMLKEIQNEN